MEERAPLALLAQLQILEPPEELGPRARRVIPAPRVLVELAPLAFAAHQVPQVFKAVRAIRESLAPPDAED